MKIELTEDQCEYIAHLIDLIDSMLERATFAEILGRDNDPEWEERMREAGQELSEEFPPGSNE